MGTPDTDRLENLRTKFLQMTSPQEFGQERKENVTIISRNVPPMLAHADAAFTILTDVLCSAPDEHAGTDYKLLAEIAENARKLATDADLLTRADHIQADFSALIESLDFLCRNLCVLSAIAEAEKSTWKRAESICAQCNPDPGFFRETERTLLKNLRSALAKLAPAFLEKRQISLESFTKADMDRFTHAHSTFTVHLRNRLNGSDDQKN